MHKVFTAIFVALFLAGCAVSKQLKMDAQSPSLKGKTMAVQVLKPSKLRTIMVGETLLQPGAIPAMIIHAVSEDVARKYAVPNPANQIANDLAQRLRSRYGVIRTSNAKKADFLLKVNNYHWEIKHHPILWTRYAPYMNVSAKLVDKRTGKTLAAGYCIQMTAETPHRSLDDLLARNAALLKRDIRTLAKKCAQKISRQMF